MGMFNKCKHDWEEYDKHVFESPFEQMKREHLSSMSNVGRGFFESKVVWIFKCKKCKNIKKVESSSGGVI